MNADDRSRPMTAPDVNADVRARFEAWASDGGKFPKAVERTCYDDGYRLMATHLYWLAWQAAHTDMAGEVRELVEADREYDKAATAVRKLSLSGVRDADHKHELDAALWAARERRDAALAKFTQEKP